MKRLQTDYIDLGMIHYVDSEEEWEQIQHSDYLDYVMELKKNGVIRHIGMSSHNPKVAMINKFYDLATMQPEVPASVKSHYELLEHKASECIGCQACEVRCPFGVPIAERMEKTAKLFGC